MSQVDLVDHQLPVSAYCDMVCMSRVKVWASERGEFFGGNSFAPSAMSVYGAWNAMQLLMVTFSRSYLNRRLTSTATSHPIRTIVLDLLYPDSADSTASCVKENSSRLKSFRTSLWLTIDCTETRRAQSNISALHPAHSLHSLRLQRGAMSTRRPDDKGP